MDLQKIADEFRDKWKKLNLESKFDREDHSITLTGDNITVGSYEGHIFLEILISDYVDYASVIMSFCFDKLEPTFGSLKLINNFNREQALLKAFISTHGYLQVEYIRRELPEEEIISEIEFALGELVEEQTKKLLKPITCMTE